MSENDPFPSVLSELYHALSAPRRCYVIQILWNSDRECLPVRELAREIAAIEEDVDPDCATGEPYRNVYNALSQTHLSTLSDTSIIIYDSDRQMIATGSEFDVAVLLIALTQAIYQTLQGNSIHLNKVIDGTSITD